MHPAALMAISGIEIIFDYEEIVCYFSFFVFRVNYGSTMGQLWVLMRAKKISPMAISHKTYLFLSIMLDM